MHLWHTPLGIRIGGFTFERSLEWVVNDGLMVIFFFVVGMEIRREIHHGELSELRRALRDVHGDHRRPRLTVEWPLGYGSVYSPPIVDR